MKKSGIGIFILLISIATVLAGCGVHREEDSSERMEGGNSMDDDYEYYYEYYLTEKELMADIDQGYIFRMDKTFEEPVTPYVSTGNWFFYVHEDNAVNLEIEFSNLFTKLGKDIFLDGEQIAVEVVSPDGQNVYRFERKGEEITEDTFVQELIPVTPGEWDLKISFSYICKGGETPSHLKISAAYESPSEEDISWLKEERLKR